MILQYLQHLACILTIAAGLFALLSPKNAVSLTGLVPQGGRGLTEIRCVMGGLSIALGVPPFLLGGETFTMLGIGYLAITAARGFSIVFDKSYAQSNLISLVIEIVLGAILVI